MPVIGLMQLQLLNPAYKRDVVPFIEGENHYLRMPNDKVAIYTSNEDKIYAYVNHETSICCIDSIKCYDDILVKYSSDSKI